MKVDFKYEQPLDEIVAEVLRMETILESEQAEAMTQIGKEIKTQVKNILPKSDEKGKHMRDDIKVTVQGKKAKTGITGVTVHGSRAHETPTDLCILLRNTSQARQCRRQLLALSR